MVSVYVIPKAIFIFYSLHSESFLKIIRNEIYILKLSNISLFQTILAVPWEFHTSIDSISACSEQGTNSSLNFSNTFKNNCSCYISFQEQTT